MLNIPSHFHPDVINARNLLPAAEERWVRLLPAPPLVLAPLSTLILAFSFSYCLCFFYYYFFLSRRVSLALHLSLSLSASYHFLSPSLPFLHSLSFRAGDDVTETRNTLKIIPPGRPWERP